MRSAQFWNIANRSIDLLALRFAGYRGVDRPAILAWLEQFDTDDDALVGLKLLDHVEYYSPAKVAGNCKDLDGKLREILAGDYPKVRFCGLGGPGTSGPSIVRDF